MWIFFLTEYNQNEVEENEGGIYIKKNLDLLTI